MRYYSIMVMQQTSAITPNPHYDPNNTSLSKIFLSLQEETINNNDWNFETPAPHMEMETRNNGYSW